jgi:uncharacterized protein YcaQ
MEFIAPLDSLIWDRRLIEALFCFEYRWEIYTPEEKRKYGPYTLPLVYGDSFVGRSDMARKDGVLVINKVWTENGKALTGKVKAAFEDCVERFAEFNDCSKILAEAGVLPQRPGQASRSLPSSRSGMKKKK